MKRRMRLAEGNCGQKVPEGVLSGTDSTLERRPHEACHRGEPTAPEKTSGAFRSTPPRGRRRLPTPNVFRARPAIGSKPSRAGVVDVGGAWMRAALPSLTVLRPGSLTAFGRANEKPVVLLRPDGPDCRPVRRTRAACRNLGGEGRRCRRLLGAARPLRDRHAVGPAARMNTPKPAPSGPAPDEQNLSDS